MQSIYLDYNATTPLDPEVAGHMIPFLKSHYGNPSSTHKFGTIARKAIDEAREKVAALIGCQPDEIIFTSGGTESNNLALRGYAYAHRERGNHIITSEIEHPAILEVCRRLEKEGFSVSYLKVDSTGKVSATVLKEEIRPETILVSIMHANNETGIIQPVSEIADIIPETICFHSDCAQTAGKIPLDVTETGVDMLSLAAHKFYGPKGVGALYVKRGIRLDKILFGANHEKNLRPGTENVLEITGMGKAAEVVKRDLEKNNRQMRASRDYIYNHFKQVLPDCKWNGNITDTLPNTLNISFRGLDSGTLLSELNNIAISAGAACHAENVEISHVLKAMKIEESMALGTLRISTGKLTTIREAGLAAKEISDKILSLTENKHRVKKFPGEKEIKLTRFTHGMGCACKISPRILDEVLKEFSIPEDKNILVSSSTSDDAAVFKINDQQAIVQTVDFFTPVVDDPELFGEIAAVNALSDIYAMGGRPLFALNIVAFPPHRLPVSVLKSILKGAENIAKEAGIYILGGHTIEDNEPKFGQAVSGLIDPGKILQNKDALKGQRIILTKKIGTGILSTALKRGLCNSRETEELYSSMRTLNKEATRIISNYDIGACTDVTGFGLTGHLLEICKASGLSAIINSSGIEYLEGAYKYASSGIIPGGTENNLRFIEKDANFDPQIDQTIKYLLSDAQTSGGLLLTINSAHSSKLISDFEARGIPAFDIGKMVPVAEKHLFVNY